MLFRLSCFALGSTHNSANCWLAHNVPRPPDPQTPSCQQLDQSFRQAPFEVPGFKSFRKGRSAHGGGLLAYVRADMPSRRRPDLETEIIESIVIETTVCDRKWAILCCYRSPSLSDNICTNDFTLCMDKLHVHFDNIIVIEDLNYDLTVPTKSKALKSVCDIFDLSSLVKKATCFTKNAPPSLI